MPPRNSLTPEHAILVPGDQVTWEVDYDDGSVARERMGATMGTIDRGRLRRFCLVAPGETIAEFPLPEGATGHNLMFRRRTFHSTDGFRRVVFLIGWAPMGPAILLDPGKGVARQEQAFIAGDPEMYPPAPAPEDGPYLLDLLVAKN